MNDRFVSRDELAALIDCQPTSRACMRRWLAKHDWPFETDRNGFPKVRQDYYDARMAGRTPTKVEATATEPNRSIFKKAS